MWQTRPGPYELQLRRIWLPMAMACVIGLLDIFILSAGASPVRPSASQADFELVPVVVRNQSGNEPKPGALLSARIGLQVPAAPSGQRLTVSEVSFFGEDGQLLGEAAVQSIRASGIWVPGLPEHSSRARILIPPLNPCEISFRATPSTSVSLEAGAKIYAEVAGTAGGQSFRVRSATAETVARRAATE